MLLWAAINDLSLQVDSECREMKPDGGHCALSTGKRKAHGFFPGQVLTSRRHVITSLECFGGSCQRLTAPRRDCILWLPGLTDMPLKMAGTMDFVIHRPGILSYADSMLEAIILGR